MMDDLPPDGDRFRLTFDPFHPTSGERLLTRDGAPIDVGGHLPDSLITPVEERGGVVFKRNLLKRVWPDLVIEDGIQSQKLLFILDSCEHPIDATSVMRDPSRRAGNAGSQGSGSPLEYVAQPSRHRRGSAGVGKFVAR